MSVYQIKVNFFLAQRKKSKLVLEWKTPFPWSIDIGRLRKGARTEKVSFLTSAGQGIVDCLVTMWSVLQGNRQEQVTTWRGSRVSDSLSLWSYEGGLIARTCVGEPVCICVCVCMCQCPISIHRLMGIAREDIWWRWAHHCASLSRCSYSKLMLEELLQLLHQLASINHCTSLCPSPLQYFFQLAAPCCAWQSAVKELQAMTGWPVRPMLPHRTNCPIAYCPSRKQLEGFSHPSRMIDFAIDLEQCLCSLANSRVLRQLVTKIQRDASTDDAVAHCRCFCCFI